MEAMPGAEEGCGLGRACPDPHVLAWFSAQGLLCYQCLGVTSEISETTCPPANCSYPDGVCISQEVETIIGEFPVAPMKMEGVAWEERSRHLDHSCLWTMVLLPPSRVLLGLEWGCCRGSRVGVVPHGPRYVLGDRFLRKAAPMACMDVIISPPLPILALWHSCPYPMSKVSRAH